ncbi:sulfite oxidase [Siphonobacter sp. SORGH_AS_0500]|nr:mono/diheme cytochrome c family protein [Siphonobacter sp. SORGH_AS_1065]PKK37192.1 sulfite oxidase [Siphonobacter sp. SORGH_AS_0500]
MNAVFKITLSILILGWASGFGSFSKPSSGGVFTSDTIFNFGRLATPADIQRWDIDIRPDGKGLPKGSGTAQKGKSIFAQKCAACHGVTGVEGPNDRLVSTDSSQGKAIGNYWPYATTVFDYIRRAMPFNQPGTLTDEEVYSLTAFLLEANRVIKPGTELNAQTLPAVQMPALKRYILDDRRGGPIIR